MKLELTNPNYCATVFKVEKLVDLENCNNVVGLICFGEQAIVGKDTKIGDIGLFFNAENALSQDFCFNNNLFRDKQLNKDKNTGGYFELNRRIKTMKFRGHKSSGLFMPLSSLNYLDVNLNDLKVGDVFNKIDNFLICEKYVNRSALKQSGLPGSKKDKKVARQSKLVEGQFRFHIDTSHLSKNMHNIDPNDLISITNKLHGCVHENTDIETLEFGILKIKEIVDKKIKCHIKSFDTTTKEIVYVPIDDYYYKKNDGDWFEIELENGQKIIITGNNPVWMPELNCYREVYDLKENDILLVD